MSKANIIANLMVTADTSQARKQLQELKSTLNTVIQSAQTKVGSGLPLTKEIREGQAAAIELKASLQAATNVDTGRLDLSKFMNNMKQSGASLESYKAKLMSMGPAGEKAFLQMAQAVSNAEIPVRKMHGVVDKLWDSMKKTMGWHLTSSVINSFSRGLSSAYGYAKDLNSSLNNIRIVSGQSTEQMAEFAKEANKAAKALGSTTTAYTDAALIYYQQGLDPEQVKERTEATLKMSNVTGQSAEEVSSQMTAVWNNFDNGSHSLEYYADVMTALGAATASSTDEIATGLEKFASVGETIGLSYEYATSALATVVAETRQSADTVGTAFKTIFSRLQGLSLGETLDDGTNLNKYSEALSKVGVQIKDEAGELKDMDTILSDLGTKWETLGKDQQVALAQTVAGTRQYTQLVALMDNWDGFQKNLGTAYNSTGTLEEQQEIYAESWEAASKRVKAASEGLWDSLLNDEFFIDLLNLVEKAISGVEMLVDSMGGFGGVLSMIAAIVPKIFGQKILDSMAQMTIAMRANSKAAQEQAVAQKKVAMSMTDQLIGKKASNKNLSTTERAEYISIKQNYELQNKIYENGERLTEQDLERIKLLQQEKQEYQKIVELTAKSVEEERQKTKEISDRIIAESSDSKKARNDVNKFSNKITDMGVTGTALLAEGYKTDNKGTDRAAWKELTNEENNIINNLAQKDSVGAKKISAALSEIKPVTEESKKAIESLQQRLENIDNIAEDDLENLKQELFGVSEAVLHIDQPMTEFIHSLTQLGYEENEAKQAAQELIDQLLKKNQAIRDNSTAINENNKKHEENLGKVDAMANKAKTTGQILMDASSGIMSLVSAWNSLASIGDTLTNEDLSPWEKFSQIMSSILMAVPMLVMGFNSLKTAITQENMATVASTIAKGANWLAIKLQTAAQRENSQANRENAQTQTLETTTDKIDTGENLKNAASEQMQSGSKKTGGAGKSGKGFLNAFKGTGLKTSIVKLLPTLAKLSGAVAIVAAVVGGAVYQFNAQAEATKKAKETAEGLTKEYDKVKSNYEQLKTSFSEYESGVEGLKELTKGTVEYNEALTSANAQATELINKYDSLAGKYHIEDGLIVFDEGALEDAQSEELKKVQNTQNANMVANTIADIEQTKLDIQTFSRNELSSSQDAAIGVGNTAITTIAGAIAGAILGAGIPGALIGGGIGLIGGGIASGAAGASSPEEVKAIEKIANAYSTNKDGMADLFVDENFTKKLGEIGIEDQALIDSLSENKDKVQELVVALDANTKARQAEHMTIMSNYLSSESDVYNNSKNQTQLAGLLGTQINEEKIQKKSEELRAAGGKSDKDAFQLEYAKNMGYTWVSDKSGKGVYLNSNNEEIEVSDEVASLLVAQKQYLAEISTNTQGLDKKLDALRVGKGTDDALLYAIAGGGTTDDVIASEDMEKNSDALKDVDSLRQALGLVDDTAWNAFLKEKNYEGKEDEYLKFLQDQEKIVWKENQNAIDIGASGAKLGDVQGLLNKINDLENSKQIKNNIKQVSSDLTEEEKKSFWEILNNADYSAWDAKQSIDKQLTDANLDIEDNYLENFIEQMQIAQDAFSNFDAETFATNMKDALTEATNIEIGEEITDKSSLYSYRNELVDEGAVIKSGDKYYIKDTKKAENYLKQNTYDTYAQQEKQKRDKIQQNQSTIDNKKKELENSTYLDGTYSLGHTSIFDYKSGEQDHVSFNTSKIAEYIKNGDEDGLIKALTDLRDFGKKNNIPITINHNLSQADGYSTPYAHLVQRSANGNGEIVEYDNDQIKILANSLIKKGEQAKIHQIYLPESSNRTDTSKLVNKSVKGKELDSWVPGLSQTEGGFSKQENEIETLEEENKKLEEDVPEISKEAAEGAISSSHLQDLHMMGLVGKEDYENNLEQASFTEAQNLGLDLDTYEAYNNQLKQSNKFLSENNGLSSQVTVNQMKMDKSLTDINSSWENYEKVLKKGNKNSSEYAKAVQDLQESFKNLFNIDVSDDFITKNLEKIEKAAKGDVKALDELQKEAGKDYVANMEINITETSDKETTFDTIRNTLTDFIDELNSLDSKVTLGENIEIDDNFIEEYGNSLQEMLDNGEIASERLNELMASQGYKFEITDWKWVDGPKTLATSRTTVGGKTTEKIIETEEKIRVPIINGKGEAIDGKAPKAATLTKISDTSQISTQNLTDDDDDNSKKDNKKEVNQEIERYHKIKKQIDAVASSMDKLNTKKDQLYGKAKLQAMNEEIALQDKQIENQKKLISEIDKNLKKDTSIIMGFGAEIGEDGTITNYEEMMTNAVNKYNSLLETDEDAANDYWDDFQEALTNYEDSVEEKQTAEEDLLQQEAERLSKILEKIDYKVTLRVELNERDMKLIEEQFAQLEDKEFNQAESMVLLGKSVKESMDNQKGYRTGIKDILSEAGADKDLISDVMSGKKLSKKDVEDLNLTPDMIDKLNSYVDGLLSENDKLRDYLNQVPELLQSGFDEWNHDISRAIDNINRLGSTLSSYRDIADLVGRDMLGLNDEMLTQASRAQMTNARAAVSATRARFEAVDATYTKYKTLYEDAVKSEKLEESKKWKEMLEGVEDERNAAQDEFLNSWQTAIEAAQQAFQDSVDLVLKNFSDGIAGIHGSIDEMQEDFNKQQKIGELYLKDYKKIYETSKLIRDINSSIDDTDNIKNQQELNSLLAEVNEYQKDGVKMSQYDLEYLQKKYDLKLAEIALEEAQNAKSSVRLTQDNEGNWGYVYSADEDKTAEAQQTYEDKLYELQDFITTSQEELTNNYIQIWKDCYDEISNLQVSDFENKAAYQAKVNEIYQHYSTLANAAVSEIEKLTGRSVEINQDYGTNLADTYSETYLGSIYPNCETFKDLMQQNDTEIGNSVDGLTKTFEQYEYDIDQIMKNAGTSVDGFKDVYVNMAKSVREKSKQAKKDVNSMKKDMNEDIDKIVKKVKNFISTYGTQMQKSINKNTEVTKSINSLETAYSKLGKAAEEAGNKAEIAATKIQNYTSSNGTSMNGTGGDDVGGQDTSKKTEQILVVPGSKYLLSSNPSEYYVQLDNGYFVNGTYLTSTGKKDSSGKYDIYKRKSNNTQLSLYSQMEHDGVDSRGISLFYPKGYMYSFDTGGYTGEWDSSGKLAMLHQKEIILNAHDTENFLDAIGIVRSLVEKIDLQAVANQMALSGYTAGVVNQTPETELQQAVTITAEFPNATDRNEIEQAFESLINQSSQFANRFY